MSAVSEIKAEFVTQGDKLMTGEPGKQITRTVAEVFVGPQAVEIRCTDGSTPIIIYARRRHAEEHEAPRRTVREPVDFAAALRPIGGVRPTSDERWGSR